MASSDVNSPPPINKEATFATQLDENNNKFDGNSVKMSSSRSRIECSSRTNNVDEPQTVRKSSRVSNLPFKFNDIVLPNNKKYVIKKHVKYSNLSTMNFCFATNLNKSYVEAAQDKNWVEAMNNEMKALFRNNTWVQTDLPLKERQCIQFYHENSLGLHDFSGAVWAKCLATRKFVLGFCVYFCGNLISWKTLSLSKLQPILCFMRRQNTLRLVKEKVASGDISTVKINSAKNVADVFTKGLSIS
nr:putative reverse transcriptase, RNA-dependent DNA polymerase, Gag-polypeptide of LTR copia-type [Tanacetum cinerariifolium]